ncbi:MAG: hypothetical protein AAFZ91_13970 [Pseudomonadota bacterium]
MASLISTNLSSPTLPRPILRSSQSRAGRSGPTGWGWDAAVWWLCVRGNVRARRFQSGQALHPGPDGRDEEWLQLRSDLIQRGQGLTIEYENMPPRARLKQALIAVSRERQSLRVCSRRA